MSIGFFLAAPTHRRTKRILVVGLTAIMAIAAVAAAYYFVVYAPSTDCVTSTGDNVYLHVLSSSNGSSLAQLPVEGQLVKSCVSPAIGHVLTLGTWNFKTNATGFVSVPSSDLKGQAFWFTVTFGGKSYLTKVPICGRGITYAQLNLPAGTDSGKGVIVSLGANETQTTEPCSMPSWQGSATIS